VNLFDAGEPKGNVMLPFIKLKLVLQIFFFDFAAMSDCVRRHCQKETVLQQSGDADVQ
jgi:hypothetical protein